MLIMKALNKYLESLLDVDFDIKDDDIIISNSFTIRAHAGLVLLSPAERLLKKQFDKYCKDFPRDLPHNKGNSFGPAMRERYFVDWACSLPTSYVADSEFRTSPGDTMISKALAKIAPIDRFSVHLVNMMGKKNITFKWARAKGKAPETFLTIELF